MGRTIRLSNKLKKFVFAKYGYFNDSSLGNIFTPLISAEKIFKEFYSVINNAEKSINMEFFIFEADKAGMAFAKLLSKKAKQGVEVNVILDFFGSYPDKKRNKMYKQMIASGVNIRFSLSILDTLRSLFNRTKYLTRSGLKLFLGRNHRKILIVDGEVAYTGGANIGRQYFWSKKNDRKYWHDFQFKISGPAVNFLQFEFFRIWLNDGGSIPIKDLDLYFRKQKNYDNGIYLNIKTNSFGKFQKLLRPILNSINNAKKYIYIENPYILNRRIINALIAAHKRGVKVIILTSLEELDFKFLKLFIERSLIRLNKAGVKVLIYPKTLLHGKAMLIDDKIAIVGTANLNNRSFYLDYELNIEIFDKKTLLYLKKELFEKDMLISNQFTKKKQRLISRIFYRFIRFLEGQS